MPSIFNIFKMKDGGTDGTTGSFIIWDGGINGTSAVSAD